MKDNVPKALKNYFNEQGITTAELGRIFGCSRVYTGGILNGTRTMGKATAHKWSEKFGFSVSWLLTGEGSMFMEKVMEERTQHADYDKLVRQIEMQNEEIASLKESYDRLANSFFTLCENNGITFPLKTQAETANNVQTEQ